MLWKTLVLWTVLCLAGFVTGGHDDSDFIYWYPGRRKLASIDSDEDEDQLRSEESSVRGESNRDYVDDDYTQTIEDYDSGKREESVDTGNKDTKLRYGNSYRGPNTRLDQYFAHTRINLYNRRSRVQVVRASQWFRNFDPNKDLVILMHGAVSTPNYVEDFFNTMAFALLQNADYNVIGIDWRRFYVQERNVSDSDRNIEELFKIGCVLQSVVQRALSAPYKKTVPRTIYIGNGLGCVPVVVQQQNYGFSFDVIFGTAPRLRLGSYDHMTLTKLHGPLVNMITVIPNPHAIGHRNFYPVKNDKFYSKGCTSFHTYYVLSKAILFGNITARFCESEKSYKLGYCSQLTEIPIWYRTMSADSSVPEGNYFFEMPPPKMSPRSGGRPCTDQEYN